MKALVLYVVFVLVGWAGSGAVGYLVEREFSSALGLIVFLTLFFASFAISWVGVVLVMDGSLKDFKGERAQREIEAKRGNASAAGHSAA